MVYSSTPLHAASYFGMSEIISLLLSHPKIDPNADGASRRTPFLLACWQNHPHVVAVMVEDGRVDLNKPDDHFHTPIWWAASNGFLECIEYMLASYRCVDLSSLKGDVPLEKNIKTLIDSFKAKPIETRITLRKQLGYADGDACKAFVLSVLLCDGYFSLRRPNADHNRFFEILIKLPIEMQMVICNRLYGVNKSLIFGKAVNQELTSMIAKGELTQ